MMNEAARNIEIRFIKNIQAKAGIELQVGFTRVEWGSNWRLKNT